MEKKAGQDDFPLEKFRDLFPIVSRLTYLNHASVSPVPTAVIKAVSDFLELASLDDVSQRLDLEFGEELRRKTAALIGASPSDVGFTENTSSGVLRAALSIGLEPGDNIVIPDDEFPANVYPWLNLEKEGVEIKFVKVMDNGAFRGHDPLFERCDDDTRIVALSHVNYLTGYRNDLVEIGDFCASRGIVLFVDAMQSAGCLRIDLRKTPADMMAFQCGKWIPSPPGTGVLYCSEKLRANLERNHFGWRGVRRAGLDDLHRHDLLPYASSRRFDGGSPCYLSQIGMEAAVDLLLEAGPEKIQERILHLTGRLMGELRKRDLEIATPTEDDRRGGIVSFKASKGKSIVDALRKQGIIVCSRGEMMRVSPHFYNTEEEIEALLFSLDRVLKLT